MDTLKITLIEWKRANDNLKNELEKFPQNVIQNSDHLQTYQDFLLNTQKQSKLVDAILKYLG